MKALRPTCLGSPASRLRVGFTLLEALLALMIFSLAVVALVEAVNQLGRTTVQQRRETQVQERLRSLMTERTRLPLPEQKELKVQEEDVTYVVTHEPLELQNKDGQMLQGLYEVKVTARWVEGREVQEISAETWVYPPLFVKNGPLVMQPTPTSPQNPAPAPPPP